MGQAKIGRGYTYNIQYHIIWCTKNRCKVLKGEVEKRLSSILHEVAEQKDFVIEMLLIDEDYVHMLVDCKPQNYIPDMLKVLKGTSGLRLIKEFKEEIQKEFNQDRLWEPSYFVATSREDIGEQIDTYLNGQMKPNK